jgi:phosphoribosylamine-glycine ligase
MSIILKYRMYAYAQGSCPNASYVSDHIISLPMHMRLTYEDVQNVIKTVYFSIDDVRDVKYPLIVKPIDSWSSKGVTRVDSQERLLNAIDRAIEESYEGKAIIEGFMEGPEYSCECISLCRQTSLP